MGACTWPLTVVPVVQCQRRYETREGHIRRVVVVLETVVGEPPVPIVSDLAPVQRASP